MHSLTAVFLPKSLQASNLEPFGAFRVPSLLRKLLIQGMRLRAEPRASQINER